jgi:hypothetical protein
VHDVFAALVVTSISESTMPRFALDVGRMPVTVTIAWMLSLTRTGLRIFCVVSSIASPVPWIIV